MRELEIYNDKKNNKGWLIALILLLVATVIALVVLLLLNKDDKGDEKSKGDVELVAQGDEGIPDDYDGCVPTAFGDDVVYVPLPRGDVEYDAKRVVDFALELQEKVTNAELLERFDEITAEMDKNIEEFYDNNKAKMEQFGKELERLSELPEYKERFKKMADRMGRIEKGTVVNEVEAKPSSVEPKIPDLPEETDEEVRTISEATNEQARPTK
ncbi:MAG: hypothetical protein IK092_00405, partial [Muribaculaceae bacterium]|nr:hypothetical protein [Muribaculaceae bacterium]